MQELEGWVVIALAVLLIAALFTFPFRRKHFPFWKHYLVASIVSAVLFFPALWLMRYLEPVLQWLLRHFVGRLAVWTTVVGIGAAAYFFKKKSQLWYGAVEVLVGGSSAAYIVSKTMNAHEPMFTKWVELAASIYVVARGLGNMSDHIEAHGDGRGNKTLGRSLASIVVDFDSP